MAPSPTRMLLLGAVALFEPVNGYQIRRELVSWQVEEWAAVRPGSIYHGLGRLADDGLLVRHDLRDGTREVSVYELTAAGRAELQRLAEAALVEVSLYDDTWFQAAFGMLPLLEPTVVTRCLEERTAALAELLDDSAPAPDQAPPHARRGLERWRARAQAEQAWLEETLAQLRTGELAIGRWTPSADDPGWQMEADRERYRRLLGR